MSRPNAAVSARDHQLIKSFESIRDTLLKDRFRERLSKPLAYWALPNDRRLPLAFLDRSIGDLINTPLDELCATPGIGHKKIHSLVTLLVRATQDQPPATPSEFSALAANGDRNLRLDPSHSFNAVLVSEALWSQWTSVVREMNLGDEKIGRVADSLNAMPTVIWTRHLGEYENLTLAKIRSLRTHGEKRVRCVLQVFHKVFETTLRHGDQGSAHLRRQLGSQRIVAVSEWLQQHKHAVEIPTAKEVADRLAEPILRQIETDCGPTVHQIASQRLGIECEAMSVRAQAQTMGVTRARIYQLLDDCNKVLEVRWPDGKEQLDRVTAKFGAQTGANVTDASLFLAVRQMCFPDRTHDESRGRIAAAYSTAAAKAEPDSARTPETARARDSASGQGDLNAMNPSETSNSNSEV